jgi:NAD-dependent SIR2 family protein deacetylase
MGVKRVKADCVKCGATFSYLPRQDGKPQRNQCYKCKPRHTVGVYAEEAKRQEEAKAAMEAKQARKEKKEKAEKAKESA